VTNTPPHRQDKAATTRVTRNRGKKANTAAEAKDFVAFVDPEFVGPPVVAAVAAATTTVTIAKQDSNASLQALTNDPAKAAAAGEGSRAAGASASATALSTDTTPYAEVEELKALPPMASDPLLASWYKDDIFRLFRRHEVPAMPAQSYPRRCKLCPMRLCSPELF